MLKRIRPEGCYPFPKGIYFLSYKKWDMMEEVWYPWGIHYIMRAKLTLAHWWARFRRRRSWFDEAIWKERVEWAVRQHEIIYLALSDERRKYREEMKKEALEEAAAITKGDYILDKPANSQFGRKI
jgi:hypothetical protein